MAATVSAWSKPGAWALDSEENEAELQQQPPKSEVVSEPLADFPSLAAAATTKQKRKKGQTLSLAEFTAKPTQLSHQHHEPQGLTAEEFLALPTGPRQRSAEELERDRGRLGGGFRSYGNNRYSSGDESSNSRWGSSRVSEEPRRGGAFNRERESGPSRADEIDNWAAGKKSTVGNNGFDRRERERSGVGFFNSQSRADDSDNWGSSKAFSPSTEGRRSSGGERKVGFTSDGCAESDNWLRMKKKEESTGADRPRLNLQPRTLPVNEGKQEGLVTVSRPSSRGSNPFGAARPREDVLAEKGQDYRKIDEQLEAMRIKEAVPERADGPGKMGFGHGNSWYATVAEDTRSWRKPEPVQTQSESDENAENAEDAEKAENGLGEGN